MGEAGRPPTQESQPGPLALAIAGVLVQVGCLIILVILAALGGGLFLDTRFNSRPLFTLLLVLGSIPITFYLLLRIVRSSTKRLQQASHTRADRTSAGREEAEGGKNS